MWISEWEELFVYPAKFGLIQLARGAIFEEALVPMWTLLLLVITQGEGNERHAIVGAPSCRL